MDTVQILKIQQELAHARWLSQHDGTSGFIDSWAMRDGYAPAWKRCLPTVAAIRLGWMASPNVTSITDARVEIDSFKNSVRSY